MDNPWVKDGHNYCPLCGAREMIVGHFRVSEPKPPKKAVYENALGLLHALKELAIAFEQVEPDYLLNYDYTIAMEAIEKAESKNG